MLRVCPECKSDEHLCRVDEAVELLPLLSLEVNEEGGVHVEYNFELGTTTQATHPIGVACRNCGWQSERYDGAPWWAGAVDEDAAIEDPEEQNADG